MIFFEVKNMPKITSRGHFYPFLTMVARGSGAAAPGEKKNGILIF